MLDASTAFSSATQGGRRDRAGRARGARLADAEPRGRPRRGDARDRGERRRRPGCDRRRHHVLRGDSASRSAGGSPRVAARAEGSSRPGAGWSSAATSENPPSAETSLRLVEVDAADEAAAFARVVRMSYGLPAATESRLAHAADAGWLCWLAFDGDEPAGAAGLYAAEGLGYLGLAGTLPEHRGKGAQNALLAARIRRAADLGCDLVVTETGERRDDRPSSSYRNILRAGFTEGAVTANWLGRS